MMNASPCPWPNVLRRGGMHRDGLEPWRRLMSARIHGRSPLLSAATLETKLHAVDMATSDLAPHILADLRRVTDKTVGFGAVGERGG